MSMFLFSISVPYFTLHLLTFSPTSGAKLAFIIFRQQFLTVQGVLRATIGDDASLSTDEEGVSEHMVRWAEKLPRESIVLVEGRVREAQQEVISTEVHQFEVDVLKVSFFMSRSSIPRFFLV
jgi:aspartyl/asparaginyl-tRNA synthetase